MTKQAVKILGIDASTKNIGWSLVSYHWENLIASGVVTPTGEFYARLGTAPRLAFKDFKEYLSDDVKVLVIEHSFFTNNPEVGKKISYMVGACICVLQPRVKYVVEVSPQEWKKATVGKGDAEKKEVQAWVKSQFGIFVKSYDECDAIGIATGYIKLHKDGHFIKKHEEKEVKKVKKARKRAAKKAAKTSQPLKGELNLWQKEQK